MRLKPCLIAVVLFFSVFLPLKATALTVSFESASIGSQASVVSQGYRFAPVYNSNVVIRNTNTQTLQPRWGDTLRVDAVDGQLFDLASFNYLRQWPGVSGTVQVKGFQESGSVLTESFSYNGTTGRTTKNLNWRNLSAVELEMEGTVQLDNFVLQTNTLSGDLIDFENISPGNYSDIAIAGMSFEPIYNTELVVRDSATHALQPRWGDTLQLRRTDSAAFSLQSFEYRRQWPRVSGTVQVIGYRMNGEVLTTSFNHNSNTTNTEQLVLNWTDLQSVQFAMQTTLQLDNFRLGDSDDPEPPGDGDPLVDASYPAGFVLSELSVDSIASVAEPQAKASSLQNVSFTDPAYGTKVYRATIASDFGSSSRIRHEYSRRQAFNADSTRFLAQTDSGHWLLYDANTFQRLGRGGTLGALNGMAGDCEPIWSADDPSKLWYTDTNGGLVWYEKNIETDTDTVMVDFSGRLPAAWSSADRIWTKSEGTSSADGRYFAFIATRYDNAQGNTIYGMFTYDRIADEIVGTLDAAVFDYKFPDHISISPSGNYVVPSWAYEPELGTRAYSHDFSSYTQLHTQSEHSDLVTGPNGEDFYVLADYDSGEIRAVNIATGVSFTLSDLYPASGESYSVHISGQAFDKPGWALISTYADSSAYGATEPSPLLREQYRKVFLAELKPGGRMLNVVHTRTAKNYGGYFGEPQATINRTGTRVMWASNFNDGGEPSSYMATIPTWSY